MIAFLKGVCVERTAEYLVVEVQGIGYLLRFAQQEKVKLNEEVLLYTYLHVREDELSLYGFMTPMDREIFLKLISVKGIGPKIGLNVFKQASADRLIKAIEEGNISYLKTLPGIGPKTASQIVLDLKGKLISQSTPDIPAEVSQNVDDALEGLKNLGYRSYEIHAISSQLSAYKDNSVDELIKLGLQLLLKQRRKT